MPDSSIAVPFLLMHNVSVSDLIEYVRVTYITSNLFKIVRINTSW